MNQEELKQAFNSAMCDPTGPLAIAAAELVAIRRSLRPGGRPWQGPSGANLAGSGAGLTTWRPAAIGQVAYIELVTLSVGGAAAAATVALYAGTVDESRLLGFLTALQGNNPSRGTIAAPGGYGWLVNGGDDLILSVTGAPASVNVQAHAQGRVEETADVAVMGGGRAWGV